jgi:Type II CAAX prenyl endopeptidase Rce1-like
MTMAHRVTAPDLTAACLLIAVPFTGHHLTAGVLTFGAVLALGRSHLAWLGDGVLSRFARRVVRVGVFLAPLPFVGAALAAAPVAIALGAGVGLILLAPDARLLRFALSREGTALLGPQAPSESVRDALFYATCGAAQEYLYRGVLLTGLATLVGWWALPVVAGMFVVEHAAQGGGGFTFDLRDYTVQVALSLALGALVLTSGGLMPALVGHTLYNMPNVLQAISRLLRSSAADERSQWTHGTPHHQSQEVER